MANQWGTGPADADERPNWFKDTTVNNDPVGTATTANTVIYSRANHPADAELLEATDRGWERVVRYGTGAAARTKREVVIANGKLGTTLTTPQIVDIRWGTKQQTAWTAVTDDCVIVVTFNQPVFVSAGTPTATPTASAGTDPICTFDADSNKTNKLTFSGATLIDLAGQTLSIGADIIGGGATIVAYDPATDAAASPPRNAVITNTPDLGEPGTRTFN
jgi:hypothetical protein